MKKRSNPNAFEVLAVTMLLCTPSDLNTLWTSSPDNTKAENWVNASTFSPAMKKHAIKFIQNNKDLKGFFKGMADLQRNLPPYAGPGPHPKGSQAAAVIAALQDLDNSGGARK